MKTSGILSILTYTTNSIF